MKRAYFDTEGDGLLKAKGGIAPISMMHCLGAIDMDTNEEHYYGPKVPADWDWMGLEPEPITKALVENPSGTTEDGHRAIMECDLAIAHNGLGFDFFAMEKVYPWFKRPAKAWDSMVLAKIVWPYDTLMGPDLARARAGKMPMKLVKRHSLEAWGHRLGEHKGEYLGDPRIADPKERYDRRWEAWNPWMAAYMMQDNRPGLKLWNMALDRIGWTEGSKAPIKWPELVLEVEMEVTSILTRQELDGVTFDIDKAQALAAHLENEHARLSRELEATFGSWWQASDVVTPSIARNVKRLDLPNVTMRRFSEKTGKELAPYVGPPLERYSPDAPYTPIEWMTFKASSRDHLGMRLQDVFGWKPKKFGKDVWRKGELVRGKPTVDESTLEEIPEAVLPAHIRTLILDFFVVAKTLGTLAKGSKAWIRLGEDGTMHGRMDPSGAITGRGTHSDPNLSGTPSVKMEKVVIDGVKKEIPLKGLKGRYGWECRELFRADHVGLTEQTGVDASSLELIDLGHYLMPKDGGLFSSRVCDPTRDPHQEHADLMDVRRADAKTVIYLKVYGGSAYKLSLDPNIVVEVGDVPELLSYRGLPMILRNLAKRFDQDFVDKLDDMQKARIARARIIIVKLEGMIEGLKELNDEVTAAAEARGWLKGLDGRKVIVRSPHAALNTLLQSAGAQTCKLWSVLIHRELNRRGLEWGRDYRQVLWLHDEYQFVHRPGLGPVIAEVAKWAIKEAGVILKLRGEYRGDAKHGYNWAQTH